MTRQALPNRRQQLSFNFRRNGVGFVGSVGFYEDGRPGEVFVSCERTTTEIEALGRDAAISISLNLQSGVSIDILRHAFTRGEDGEAASFIGTLLDELDTLLGRPDAGAVPVDDPTRPPLAPAGGEYVGLARAEV